MMRVNLKKAHFFLYELVGLPVSGSEVYGASMRDGVMRPRSGDELK